MSDDRNETPAGRWRDLLERLDKTPLGAGLLDDNARRRRVFELLGAAEDPLRRELGRELAAGNIGLQATGAVPAYREVLESGMRHLASLDLDAMAGRLEEAIAIQEEKQAAEARRRARPAPEDDDGYVPVIHDDGR